MMDPERATFRNTRLMTPAALLLLWEMCYALRELTKIPRGRTHHIMPAAGGSDYSESRFLQLCEELRRLANRLQLRAVVIDNAQHIDERGLRKLIEMRDRCQRPFAVILGYQMQKHAKLHEGIQSVLVASGAFDQWSDARMLEPVGELEFYKTTLPRQGIALETEFDPDIEADFDRFQKDLWKHSRGNWHRELEWGNWHLIERLVMLFDQELGPRRGDLRIITPAVEKRVYQRLDNVRQHTTGATSVAEPPEGATS